MDIMPVPDWIRNDPRVLGVKEWHLPPGSGISGPPAAAFQMDVKAVNAIQPRRMWHLLFAVSDEDLAALARSRVLVLSVSAVPIVMVHPWEGGFSPSDLDQEGTPL